MSEMRRHLEPNQLGMGTPDGVVMVVLLLRAWTEAIQHDLEPNEPEEDPLAIIPLDLKNAYGMFLRSHALTAAIEFNADVASLAAAEWSQSPEYWIEVNGAWRRCATQRGFWQGRRLAMLMFCLSLAKSLSDPALGLRPSNLKYVSIQDDTYLMGPLRTFSEKREGVANALAAGGHELQPAKCQAWVPTWDEVQTHGLPSWAQEFFASVPRARFGVHALGAASQGKHEFVWGLGLWQLLRHASGFSVQRPQRKSYQCTYGSRRRHMRLILLGL